MELDIVQAISTVGFPIVAYLLLYFHGFKVISANTQAILEFTKTLQQKL